MNQHFTSMYNMYMYTDMGIDILTALSLYLKHMYIYINCIIFEIQFLLRQLVILQGCK